VVDATGNDHYRLNVAKAGEFGAPREIVVGDYAVRVSSPDKPYFPEVGLTKGDVVEFYATVAPALLTATHSRPTTLERYPDGVTPGAESFFQKRAPAKHPDWIKTCRVTFPSGNVADELAPDHEAAVVWAANLGTITFHPWPVRCGDVEAPDQLRIDLDPQPGTGFAEAVEVGWAVRELLAEHGLTGWPKTSGGRGLHIFVPIEPRWTFADVRNAALAVGREVEKRLPSLVTTAWWKEERPSAIFVDYNQNARDRTIASAWSIRPRANAPVSTPVTWDDLKAGIDPADFTVHTVPDYYAEHGDKWSSMVGAAFDLQPLLDLSVAQRSGGQEDAPWPTFEPKVAGEPRRVRPSQAKSATDESKDSKS
jgi:DNA ligase D